MASDTKRTSFPQASSAIATTALTQSLARTHAASIERAALHIVRPEAGQCAGLHLVTISGPFDQTETLSC